MTVIVPAHNEGRVIGRLLDRLVRPTGQGDLDIIVVTNGCTDDTAAVAAAFGPPVRVLDIPVPSKRAALAASDEAATGFPRVYLDADVEIGADDLWALDAALAAPGVLAAAPVRHLDLARSEWVVRWYYDVWQRLPKVQQGLFGRGVIAVSEAGHRRIAELPPLMADDLAASLSFGPDERVIAGSSHVMVHAPRTVGDLLRRRVRVVTGVEQIERSADAPDSSQRTNGRDLLDVLLRHPLLTPKVAIFLIVTVLARRRGNHAARKNDYTTWLRDESSRG
jgi:glycosyltransferase involved in cell wall biosynthesis